MVQCSTKYDPRQLVRLSAVTLASPSQMLHSAAKQASEAGATQREEKRQSQREARTERVERARGKNGQFVANKKEKT